MGVQARLCAVFGLRPHALWLAGFITSNLTGKREDGALIKEFEASHGTVTDLYERMLRGEDTSLNRESDFAKNCELRPHSLALQRWVWWRL